MPPVVSTPSQQLPIRLPSEIALQFQLENPISAPLSFKQAVCSTPRCDSAPPLLSERPSIQATILTRRVPATIKEVIHDIYDVKDIFPFVRSRDSIFIAIDDDYYQNRCPGIIYCCSW